MESGFPFQVGDTVKVSQKIQEAKKERVVSFTGQVVGVKGAGSNRMFTVRSILEGVGVERIFPLVSPTITKVQMVEKPKKRVRRARLLRMSGS